MGLACRFTGSLVFGEQACGFDFLLFYMHAFLQRLDLPLKAQKERRERDRDRERQKERGREGARKRERSPEWRCLSLRVGALVCEASSPSVTLTWPFAAAWPGAKPNHLALEPSTKGLHLYVSPGK